MAQATFAPASRKQQMVLESKAQILVTGGAAGCVDMDTEFMSQYGWKKISDYKKGDKVLQHDPQTNKTTFVDPLAYIKLPAEHLWHVKSRGLDMVLSDEHKVLYYKDDRSGYHILPFHKLREKHVKLKGGWKGKIPTAFNYDGAGVNLPDSEFKEIVYLSLQDKQNFPEEFYHCSRDQFRIIHSIIREYFGSVVRKERNITTFYETNNKKTADFLQFASCSMGINSSIETRKSSFRTNKKYLVRFMTHGRGFRSIANPIKPIDIPQYKTKDGFKYCFTVPSGFFVIRRNDEVCVTGNSGKSYLLQLLPLLIIDDPKTACIMFRRTVPQIRGQGGLFDKAKDIYNQLPAGIKPRFKENEMTAIFPNGATIKWQSMQHVSDKLNIQGLEFTFIGVD